MGLGGIGFFQKLKQGLEKTSKSLIDKLDAIIPGRAVDDALIEELETVLLSADFGMTTTRLVLDEALASLRRSQRNDAARLRQGIREAILGRLTSHQPEWTLSASKPHVILVVGVNGVGKTTTIGKLAAQFGQEGKKVLLAAGDTFRAAAVAQLTVWGERSGCQVISQGQNADSASVVFDAHSAALAKRCDLLIADTAGRLHTKVSLMEEIKKIKRVLSRQDPAAPHDVWLVLDATTGQNAINQVRQFHQTLGLTGLIITKLDGTAKGGVVVGIHEEFKLPIRFIGVGEGVDDLRPFEPAAFVSALFGEG